MKMFASLGPRVLVPEFVDSYFGEKDWSRADFERGILKQPAFQAALKNQRNPLNQLFLDQKLVAGLGTSMWMRSFYRAKVHPARLGQSLLEKPKQSGQRNDCCACSLLKGWLHLIRSLQQCFWRRRHHAGRTLGLRENRPTLFALGGTPIEKIQLGTWNPFLSPLSKRSNQGWQESLD